jgi:hypothetical protein
MLKMREPNGIPSSLDADFTWSPIVSPTADWLAWMSLRDPSGAVWLMNGEGKATLVFDGPDDWYGLLSWLNENEIVVGRERTFSELDPVLPPQLFLDPFQEETRQAGRAFPELDPYPEADHVWPASTVFHPTLPLVAYIAFGSGQSLDIRLWDFSISAELGRLEPFVYGWDPPKWSPDGQMLIVENRLDHLADTRQEQDDFFAISPSGAATRLTQFADEFPVFSLGPFQWSPNGKTIAFLYRDTQLGGPNSLAILDPLTLTTVDLCIEADYGPNSIVWSPSSRQLLVKQSNNGRENSKVVLVDLDEQYAAPIASGFEPIAWLISP